MSFLRSEHRHTKTLTMLGRARKFSCAGDGVWARGQSLYVGIGECMRDGEKRD